MKRTTVPLDLMYFRAHRCLEPPGRHSRQSRGRHRPVTRWHMLLMSAALWWFTSLGATG